MKSKLPIPPKYAEKLLNSILREDLAEEILGDLEEKFYRVAEEKSIFKAKLNYWYQTLNYLRPFAIRKSRSNNSIYYAMYKNYFKIGYRNLLRNKGYSIINIGGLAVGIAVALTIGLWVQEEINFDKSYQNYNHIAQIKQHQTFNSVVTSHSAIPIPLEKELRENYGEVFKYIAISSWEMEHIISYGDKKITKSGNFMGAEMPHILSLNMIAGNHDALKELKSIIISQSTAEALFGDEDPIGKIVSVDQSMNLSVNGVYEDLPYNASFQSVKFIANFENYGSTNPWVKEAIEAGQWDNNSFQLFVQIAEQMDMTDISKKIERVKYDHLSEEDKIHDARLFLHPMRDWHLRSEWKNGLPNGGMIQNVWLFSIIGIIVLLLACINFMNLSTAQSEKRAKEVGIRKSIGSTKNQLINQFMTESFLVVILAFIVALLIVFFTIPYFNYISGKHITIDFLNPIFWLVSLGFMLVTGFLAGSYPALYLSSFNRVQVLKGTFRTGKSNVLFRKVLVVGQFSISIALIIGTLVVYNQIQFTKNRPMGYDYNGVILVQKNSPDYKGKLNILQDELKKNNAVLSMSESSSPLTDVWSVNGGYEWEGKDPNLAAEFATIYVTPDFGKTIGWNIKKGRDFSKDFATDTAGIIVNQAAIDFMSMTDPIGQNISWSERNFKILGVVDNLIMESPFESIRPTAYFFTEDVTSWIEMKLNTELSTAESLDRIDEVYKDMFPNIPFEYKFVSLEHAKKFEHEERIGNLSAIFSSLAIFISCVGLFGLSAFSAEQRTKEIGIRKVLGANLFNLWNMLSQEFMVMVVLASLIAIPCAYYFLASWLEKYEYHTSLAWWIFVLTAIGALFITLFTVSFQAIKAAQMNPVKSLRSE